MRKLIIVIVVLVGIASAQNWTQLGFSAEPGVSVGTPCVLNLMARFWYRGFGISGCGLWLPSGFNYLSGSGAEADVMYRLFMTGVSFQPFVALGYGNSDVKTSLSGAPALELQTNYVGLQVGAYYMGAFAQIGLGVGLSPSSFTITNGGGRVLSSQVFPLLQIGYTGSIGSSSSSSSGSSGGSGSGGSSGGGSSGGGHTK